VRRSTPADREVSWFHQWRPRGAPRWLSIGRVTDPSGGYLLRFPQLADFAVSEDATQIEAEPAAGLPDETLRHLLIDQVLPLVASRHGRLALHASAVHLHGFGTIGFVGAAGRGKSTLAAAFALAGAGIVADDCLAIDLGDNRVMVDPAYPGLRLWPKGAGPRLLPDAEGQRRVAHYSTKRRTGGTMFRYRSTPSPLRALLLLRPRATRGPAAQITACPAPARLMGLLRYAYILDVQDRRDLAASFDRLATTAARVPVLRVRVRHGLSRLDGAVRAIRESLEGRGS
jgi:hypothetical protein